MASTRPSSRPTPTYPSTKVPPSTPVSSFSLPTTLAAQTSCARPSPPHASRSASDRRIARARQLQHGGVGLTANTIATSAPPGRAAPRPRRLPHHPTRLTPGVEAAVNVAGTDDPSILCRLHGHRRALAKGAIKHDAFVGRRRQLMQHAAGADVLLQVGIGCVQR